MSVAYSELRSQADARWHELTSGDRPWVRVGLGTNGEAAGAEAVHEAIEKALESAGVEANVSFVGSMGLCYAEPLVDITLPGGPRVFYANLGPDEAGPLVTEHIRDGSPRTDRAFAYSYEGRSEGDPPAGIGRLEDMPSVAPQVRIATRKCGDIDPRDIYQYIADGGYQAVDRALETMEPAQVLEEVKNAGLRGRGGAAFPTGVKWGFLAPSPAPEKYILCNCEEGDPGAFNDKGILESNPHTLVEGMILAGYATNSTHGMIFVRQGHTLPIENARQAIRDAYEAGLLGDNILGSEFSFHMEVALTGDSYVAGEETAMMEAIEGNRSMPRYKPPFPAQFGVWGKPSNINNVKTLSYVPYVVYNGADKFKEVGTEGSSGTAILCITGPVKRPGMYEIPMGMTIRQAIDEVAGGMRDGKKMKVLQTGGPLGGVLGEENFDVEIDFDAMSKAGAILGSGGIIVGSEDVNIVDLTRNLVAFLQFESCGKCFPCRLGTTHLLETMERICRNEARSDDLDLMNRIGSNMKVGSLCGHGQLGFNPVLSALQYFGDEFDAAINRKAGPVGWLDDGSMVLPTRTRPAEA